MYDSQVFGSFQTKFKLYWQFVPREVVIAADLIMLDFTYSSPSFVSTDVHERGPNKVDSLMTKQLKKIHKLGI